MTGLSLWKIRAHGLRHFPENHRDFSPATIGHREIRNHSIVNLCVAGHDAQCKAELLSPEAHGRA